MTIEYSLSGFFEIELDTVISFTSGNEYQTISLISTGLVSTTPTNLPFELSSLTGLFNGNDFSARSCDFLAVIHGGFCFDAGNIEFYSGSIDSRVLTLSGNAPIDSNFSYIYEITAKAVPLPGSALLYLSCLLSSFIFRRVKSL